MTSITTASPLRELRLSSKALPASPPRPVFTSEPRLYSTQNTSALRPSHSPSPASFSSASPRPSATLSERRSLSQSSTNSHKPLPIPAGTRMVHAISYNGPSDFVKAQPRRVSQLPRSSSENTAVSIYDMYEHDSIRGASLDYSDAGPEVNGARYSTNSRHTAPSLPNGVNLSRTSTSRSRRDSELSNVPDPTSPTEGLAYLDQPFETTGVAPSSFQQRRQSSRRNVSTISADFSGISSALLNGDLRSSYADSTFDPSVEESGPSRRSISLPVPITDDDGRRHSSHVEDTGLPLSRQSSSRRPSSAMETDRRRNSHHTQRTPKKQETSLPPIPSSPNPASHPTSPPKPTAQTPSQTSLTTPFPSHLHKPTQTSIHSQPQSHRGADEDADATHVRNVYARFEATGVPHDGFVEGIERTRARVLSTYGIPAGDEGGATKGVDMTPREEEILRTMDRYGFFASATSAGSGLSTRQESRMALLPAAPLARRIKRLGPSATPVALNQIPSPAEYRGPSSVPSPTKEVGRMAKWTEMMRVSKRDEGGNILRWSPDGHGVQEATFRNRVWKGIPDRWRPAAWQMMITRKVQERGADTREKELDREYRENIDIPSPHDVQIDLDVPRTISGHMLFHTRYGQGQRSLFHILHCFSLVCKDCEYCQGMGPVAATLMLYLEPEHAYAGLVHFHDQYDMHSIFQPGFPGLLEAIFVQEKLIEALMPEVYKSFQTHMVSSTSYATKWYITLFSNSVPYQTQLRIWDAFLLEGRDVMVMTAVAIIWVLKDYLASPQASFETILSLLSSFFVPQDEDALISWIHTTLSNEQIRSQISTWRRQWSQIVASGQQSKALL